MADCVFCDTPLASGPPWAPGPGYRLAFDPYQGRLWSICPRCSRWNLTPLEDRWESLEACEAAVQERGKLKLSTTHLALIDVGDGELVRVGRSQRPEFVDWRYGPRISTGGNRPGFWSRILLKLPSPPVEGYDPYQGVWGALRSAPWLASPFLHAASPLTYLFSQVPLAPSCPSCGRPLALRPWDFQNVRFVLLGRVHGVEATCGFCEVSVTLELVPGRAALRLGLGLVVPSSLLEGIASDAARELEAVGGPTGLMRQLSGSGASLGELEDFTRAGLLISLDEMAEIDALEAEWRVAEEIGAIMDGELTQVPGFEEFRRGVLDNPPE